MLAGACRPPGPPSLANQSATPCWPSLIRGFEESKRRAPALGAAGHRPLAWAFLRFRSHSGRPVKGRLALQLHHYLPWAVTRAARRQAGSARHPAGPDSEVLQGTALAAFQSWQALVQASNGHSSMRAQGAGTAAAATQAGAGGFAAEEDAGWQQHEVVGRRTAARAKVGRAAAGGPSGLLQLPSWPPPKYPAALHLVVSEACLQVGERMPLLHCVTSAHYCPAAAGVMAG